MRVKLLAGLTTVVALCAFAATPVFAQWSGTPTSVTAGPGEFTLEAGKLVKCASATSTTPKNTGTELNLGTITWNTCTGEVGGVKIPAVVECKELTLEQPAKEGVTKGKATGKVVSLCVVKLTGASCTINVGTTKNQKLANTTLAKEGSKQKDVVEVSPIEATTTGAGCEISGLTKTYTAATLKVPSLVVSPLELI
jgi:hypothetical protein